MKKLLRKFPVMIIGFILLPAIIYAQNEQIEKAPAVILKDLKGKTINLKDFKGKVILVNFWATWCAPCLAETPELIKWQKEYEKQGLQIIGITYPPTNIKKVRDFVSKNKINYPILFGSKKTKAVFSSSEIMPFSIIIDGDGNIRGRIEGVIFADEFDEKVKPFLKSETALYKNRVNQ